MVDVSIVIKTSQEANWNRQTARKSNRLTDRNTYRVSLTLIKNVSGVRTSVISVRGISLPPAIEHITHML